MACERAWVCVDAGRTPNAAEVRPVGSAAEEIEGRALARDERVGIVNRLAAPRPAGVEGRAGGAVGDRMRSRREVDEGNVA
jgi:hypothetical protein